MCTLQLPLDHIYFNDKNFAISEFFHFVIESFESKVLNSAYDQLKMKKIYFHCVNMVEPCKYVR